MFKLGFTWLWSKCPAWARWAMFVLVVPNLIINTFIFFRWVKPWYVSDVHATIQTYKEKRDTEILSIVTKQEFQNQMTSDSLKRIEQHQGLIFAELIRRHTP